MNETYEEVRGEWKYLYRAMDKEGNTVDFLPRAGATRLLPGAILKYRSFRTAPHRR